MVLHSDIHIHMNLAIHKSTSLPERREGVWRTIQHALTSKDHPPVVHLAVAHDLPENQNSSQIGRHGVADQRYAFWGHEE